MGNKIRMERKRQKLSQKELSEKANVSRTIISGIECGKITKTTTTTLQKIADALGKSVAEIFFDDKV